MSLSLPHLLILVALTMSWVVPLCMIVSRTGRHWAWGLLAIFPLLAVALLWVLAVTRWPIFKAPGRDRARSVAATGDDP